MSFTSCSGSISTILSTRAFDTLECTFSTYTFAKPRLLSQLQNTFSAKFSLVDLMRSILAFGRYGICRIYFLKPFLLSISTNDIIVNISSSPSYSQVMCCSNIKSSIREFSILRANVPSGNLPCSITLPLSLIISLLF